MKTCFLRILLLGCLLVNVVGCSSSGSSGPSSLTLEEGKSGGIVEINSGETFIIVLEGNPTTGYTWEVETIDATILQQLGEPDFSPDSNAIGSGGKFTFRFKAISVGQSPLKLIYHRPWEQDVPPLKTFELTVVVK